MALVLMGYTTSSGQNILRPYIRVRNGERTDASFIYFQLELKENREATELLDITPEEKIPYDISGGNLREQIYAWLKDNWFYLPENV